MNFTDLIRPGNLYAGWPKQFIRIMKLTIIIMTSFLLQVSAITYAQITLSEKNAPFESVIKSLKTQSGYDFFYNGYDVKHAKPVTLNLKNVPLTDALKACFADQNLTYSIEDKTVVIKAKEPTFLERVVATLSNIDVRGRVTDENGNALPGAVIKVKGTSRSTSSNIKGEFSLNGVKEDVVLVISYIGYDVLEITAKEVASSARIILKENIGKLDETVIIGYGTTTQKLNTGSVSRVTAKEIEQQPVSNVLLAMQGRVPGLVISPVSGLPGAQVKVQLRGQNSLLNGSDPLFIIDGVPMASGNNGVTSGGIMSPLLGFGTNGSEAAVSPFSSINPDDIESIEVLKDADATSIYGSRGANGVILITTKKGKPGKTSVNATVSSGISQNTKLPKMLNEKEYLQVRNEAFQNDGITPTKQNAYDLLVWDPTRDTNWEKFITGNTAKTTNATASISGGNKSTQFLLGAGYHHDGTVFLGNSSSNRASFNVNLNNTSANGRLSTQFSSLFSSNTINFTQGGDPRLPPVAPPIYDALGQFNWGSAEAPFANPVALSRSNYETKTDNLVSSLSLAYNITSELKIRTRVGYNSILSNEIAINPLIAQDPNSGSPMVGSSEFATTSNKSWSVEPQLEFTKDIFGGHLNALLGGSWQKNEFNTIGVDATGYANDALLRSISAAPIIQSVGNGYSLYKYAALFGRINYNLDDKYLINLSGRRDGSSRFGPDRRYSNFGAIGAAWVISNENFIKENIPLLSYLKLRGSYGITGSDQIGDYKYLDAWSTRLRIPYQGTTALTADGLFNSNYNWERNRKLEGALEVGLWQNKLLATFNYYRNRCDNQLILYNLPAQTGFYSVTANLPAVLQNSGLEMSINASIITTKNFKWNLGGNITIPRDKILSFPDVLTSPYASIYTVGDPINTLRGYHSTGIDKSTGVYTFADLDGDHKLTNNDYVTIGSLAPKYYGGISNHFSYKGIDLDLFIEFKKQTGKNYLFWMYRNSPGFIINQPEEILHSQGEVQKYTTTTTSDAYKQLINIRKSDVVYSDASYARLKNVSLSYNLSPMLKNKVALLRVFVEGQNLLTITKFKVGDPETQSFISLPPLRTITAGLQLTL